MPNDPLILLSYINTKLRDTYPSFDELCKSECVSVQEISDKLSAVGYEYDAKLNQFV